MAFQLFRGNDTQVAAYNGADGELVYNMTNKSLHIYDGVTVGGYEFKNAEAMKQDLLDGASAAYDTLKEIEDYINNNEGNVGTILTNMKRKYMCFQNTLMKKLQCFIWKKWVLN